MELKKAILDYLQKQSLDLRKKYSLADLKFEDDPPRLVAVARNEVEIPNISHKGNEITVEVVIETANPVITMSDVNNPVSESATTENELSPTFKKSMGISEALGPQVVTTEQNMTDTRREAIEAWKKRHKSVKTG